MISPWKLVSWRVVYYDCLLKYSNILHIKLRETKKCSTQFYFYFLYFPRIMNRLISRDGGKTSVAVLTLLGFGARFGDLPGAAPVHSSCFTEAALQSLPLSLSAAGRWCNRASATFRNSDSWSVLFLSSYIKLSKCDVLDYLLAFVSQSFWQQYTLVMALRDRNS
jgi:hypothetical protein